MSLLMSHVSVDFFCLSFYHVVKLFSWPASEDIYRTYIHLRIVFRQNPRSDWFC